MTPNNEDRSPDAARADLQSAITSLAQQLATRAAAGRPMRASMQGAYRALMDREFERLGQLQAPPARAKRREDG